RHAGKLPDHGSTPQRAVLISGRMQIAARPDWTQSASEGRFLGDESSTCPCRTWGAATGLLEIHRPRLVCADRYEAFAFGHRLADPGSQTLVRVLHAARRRARALQPARHRR